MQLSKFLGTRRQRCLGVLVVAAGWSTSAAAQSTWVPTATGTFSWLTGSNWSTNPTVPNAAGAVARLTNAITGSQTITLDASVTLGTLSIGAASGTNAFTLGAGSGGALTFDVASGTASLSKTSGGSDTIATAITLADPLEIQVATAAASPLTISGIIGGAGQGFVKTGTGTLILAAANSYGGATTIDRGVLRFTADQSLAGGLAYGSGTAVTTSGTIDFSAASGSFGSLAVRTLSATDENGLEIGPLRGVTVTGGVTIGGAGASSNTHTTTTLFRATGSGTFAVLASGSVFQVGGATAGAGGNAATADFGGLGTLVINLGTSGTVRIGDNNSAASNANGNSTLILGATSAITANLVRVGAAASATLDQRLRLGSGTTTLNVNTLQIAHNRSGGSVDFAGPTGSVRLRAADGSSRAALNVLNTAGDQNPSALEGTLALAGHDADLFVSTLTIGSRERGATGVGLLTFDSGTLDATSLVIGRKSREFSTGAVSGTLSIGGGSVVIGSATMAVNSGSAGTATAAIAVTGGSVTFGTGAGTAVNMATSGTAYGQPAVSTITLSGGTTTIAGNVVRTGSGSGSETATVVLAGGRLDMAGFSIGASARQIGLTAQAGTLLNLGELNGGGPLVKSGTGTLVLSGTSTFAGATTVNEGLLRVTGLLANTSGVTVSAGATLGGSGSIDAALAGAGVVAPGSSPGILTATQFNPAGGLGARFEITGTAPAWGTAAASTNDVLRLSSATPFTASLSAANVIDVLFGLSGGSPITSGTYLGGFFTDADSDFLATIENGTFRYWVSGSYGDPGNQQTFTEGLYSPLAAFDANLSVTLSTVGVTAGFAGGAEAGYVTQFVVVPEPDAMALAGLGTFLGLTALRQARRLKRQDRPRPA